MKRLLGVLAAAVLLGACAGTTPRGSGSRPRLLPIEAGARPSSGANTSAGANGREPALAPLRLVTYRAAEGLAELGGRARAYRVVGREASLEDARRVAEAFGVVGEPRRQPCEAGSRCRPMFTVGADARLLTVSSGSGGVRFDLGGSAASVVGPSVCSTEQVCRAAPAPAPPVGVTADDATRTALEHLRAAGVAVEGVSVHTAPGVGAWEVTVTPTVAGVGVGELAARVVVDARGVSEATGVLGPDVRPADEYPLVGTRAAIDALNRGSSGGLEAQRPALGVPAPSLLPPVSDCATDASTTTMTSPGPSGNAAGGSGAGAGCVGNVGPDPVHQPPEPPGDIAPRVVTITGARHTLLFAAAVNDSGDAYLIPAYLFSTARGDAPAVFAIDTSWFTPTPGPLRLGAPGSANPGSVEPQGTEPSPAPRAPR